MNRVKSHKSTASMMNVLESMAQLLSGATVPKSLIISAFRPSSTEKSSACTAVSAPQFSI